MGGGRRKGGRGYRLRNKANQLVTFLETFIEEERRRKKKEERKKKKEKRRKKKEERKKKKERRISRKKLAREPGLAVPSRIL